MAWYKEPVRHSKASKKGWLNRKRKLLGRAMSRDRLRKDIKEIFRYKVLFITEKELEEQADYIIKLQEKLGYENEFNLYEKAIELAKRRANDIKERQEKELERELIKVIKNTAKRNKFSIDDKQVKRIAQTTKDILGIEFLEGKVKIKSWDDYKKRAIKRAREEIQKRIKAEKLGLTPYHIEILENLIKKPYSRKNLKKVKDIIPLGKEDRLSMERIIHSTTLAPSIVEELKEYEYELYREIARLIVKGYVECSDQGNLIFSKEFKPSERIRVRTGSFTKGMYVMEYIGYYAQTLPLYVKLKEAYTERKTISKERKDAGYYTVELIKSKMGDVIFYCFVITGDRRYEYTFKAYKRKDGKVILEVPGGRRTEEHFYDPYTPDIYRFSTLVKELPSMKETEEVMYSLLEFIVKQLKSRDPEAQRSSRTVREVMDATINALFEEIDDDEFELFLGSGDKAFAKKHPLNPEDPSDRIKWLSDTRKYDLEGVDTPTKLVTFEDLDRESIEKLKKIGITPVKLHKLKKRIIRKYFAITYSPHIPEEVRAVLRQTFEPLLTYVLTTSFTAEELKQLGKVWIHLRPVKAGGLKGVTGGVETVIDAPRTEKYGMLYIITINPSMTTDCMYEVVIHELIHALRDAQGRHVRNYLKEKQKEETQTEFETVIRSDFDKVKSMYGYYEGDTEKIIKDYKLAKKESKKAWKGKKAVRTAMKKYPESEISKMEV